MSTQTPRRVIHRSTRASAASATAVKDLGARECRRVPVDIYINKMINGVPHLARTRDLSRTGLFLHRLLEPTTPTRARISLEFVLPGTDEVIWADAEVMHGRNTRRGVGLRFLDLTPAQETLIRSFVENSSAC